MSNRVLKGIVHDMLDVAMNEKKNYFHICISN